MATDLSQDIPDLMARAEQSRSAARLLIDNGFLAEAISRAYYAMFYAATALLHSEGIAVSKHSAVIAKAEQDLPMSRQRLHTTRPMSSLPQFATIWRGKTAQKTDRHLYLPHIPH